MCSVSVSSVLGLKNDLGSVPGDSEYFSLRHNVQTILYSLGRGGGCRAGTFPRGWSEWYLKLTSRCRVHNLWSLHCPIAWCLIKRMGQLYGFGIPVFVFTSNLRSDHCSNRPSFPKIVGDIDFPEKPTNLLNLILISASSLHVRNPVQSSV